MQLSSRGPAGPEGSLQVGTMRQYWVYILASRSRRLYVGVTNNLLRRVIQHRLKAPKSFTARYDITRLVYAECTGSIRAAIAREKQIKGWSRAKKLALIGGQNPGFVDLAQEWFGLVPKGCLGPPRAARGPSE